MVIIHGARPTNQAINYESAIIREKLSRPFPSSIAPYTHTHTHKIPYATGELYTFCNASRTHMMYVRYTYSNDDSITRARAKSTRCMLRPINRPISILLPRRLRVCTLVLQSNWLIVRRNQSQRMYSEPVNCSAYTARVMSLQRADLNKDAGEFRSVIRIGGWSRVVRCIYLLCV